MEHCHKHNYPYAIMCPHCAMDRVFEALATSGFAAGMGKADATPEPFPASDEQKEQPHSLNPQYDSFIRRNPEFDRELKEYEKEISAEVETLIRSDPRVK